MLRRKYVGRSSSSREPVEHYLLAVIYPTGLTASTQRLLGAAVIVLNAGVYLWLLRRRRAALHARVTPPEP